MPNLTLYYKPTCPYCLKVLAFMKKNKISIPSKNTLINAQHREELIKIGGKSQIPCLIIDNTPLYESNDIIEWFKENHF